MIIIIKMLMIIIIRVIIKYQYELVCFRGLRAPILTRDYSSNTWENYVHKEISIQPNPSFPALV